MAVVCHCFALPTTKKALQDDMYIDRYIDTILVKCIWFILTAMAVTTKNLGNLIKGQFIEKYKCFISNNLNHSTLCFKCIHKFKCY